MKTVVHIKCIELSSYGLKSINLNVASYFFIKLHISWKIGLKVT